jgi:hypothetical protein
MIVISECFPPRERGARSAPSASSSSSRRLGPPSAVTWSSLSWRFIFTINLPVGVLALIAAEMVLRPGERTPDREFDWGGFCGLRWRSSGRCSR